MPARVLAWAAMAVVPCCVAHYSRRIQSRFGWLAVLLWFSFPMSWWAGKVTGPETFSLALSTLAATIVLCQPAFIGLITAAGLLGLAVGIKLTAMPVGLFVVILLWKRGQLNLRTTCALMGGGLLGFVIANPFMLANGAAFGENMFKVSNAAANSEIPHYTPTYLAYLFSNSVWEWDYVYRGGFFNWGLTIPAFAIWLLFLWRAKADQIILLAFTVTLVFTTALLMRSSQYLGWYWFPIIALLPLVTASVRAAGTLGLMTFGLLLLVTNVSFASPFVRQQWQARMDHRQAIKDGLKWQARVEEQIVRICPDVDDLMWYVRPGLVQRPTNTQRIGAPGQFLMYDDRRAYSWVNDPQSFKSIPLGSTVCIVMDHSYYLYCDRVNRCGLFKPNKQFDTEQTTVGPFNLVFVHHQADKSTPDSSMTNIANTMRR